MFLFFCCCFCFLIFIPRSTFDRSVHSSRFKKIDNVHFLLDKFIREYISLARYSAHLIEIEPYKIYKYRLKINTPLFSKSWITAQFFGIRVVFDVDHNKYQKKNWMTIRLDIWGQKVINCLKYQQSHSIFLIP